MNRPRTAAVLLAFLLIATGARAQTSSRVLVMPFENTARDSRIVWLSEAVAVLVADELNARGLEAIARDERIAAFTRLKVPPAVALTDATIIRLGRLVGASEVVVGTVRLNEDVLTVQARSIALDTGRLRDRIDERGSLTEIFEITDRVSARLTGAPGGAQVLPSRTRPPVAAFEQYIKGLLSSTPATAISYLNAALDLAPGFASPRLAQWDVHTEQSEFARALAAVESVPASAPEYPRARFLASLSYISLERYGDAFAILETLSNTHPTASIYNNLGIVQLRRGSTPRTGLPTYYFTHAANADGQDADYCFNLGYAYFRERNAEAAIYWLRQAVRRNPADDDAHLVLSAALDLAGNPAEAQRELELARRLSETYAEGSGRAAELMPRGLERVKTSLAPTGWARVDAALLDASQRDERELAAFYLGRARVLFAEERDEEALDQIRRALFLSPYDAEAHTLTGRIHLRAGRVSEAIGALQIALWSDESAATYAALATAYLEGDDAEEARASALRALDLDPDLAEAWEVLDRLDRN